MPKSYFGFSPAARAACVLLAAGAASWSPVSAQTQPYTGASVFGLAAGVMELSCHTCTNYPILLANESEVGLAFAGGQGATSASFNHVAVIDRNATLASFPDAPETPGPDYSLGGGAAFAASAAFSGPLATPVLRARASSDNPRVYLTKLLPQDDDLHVGWNYFTANATAFAAQGYTFLGSERTTYSFQFTVDGLLQDPRASLSGAAFVHDGDSEMGGRSRAETSLATNLLTGSESLTGSFSISMTFDPGETLYLETSLSASASGSFQDSLLDYGHISANGMNTMWVSSITGGDTTLLTPTLAVPEPASTAMLLLGLGALVAVQRRRGGPGSVVSQLAADH